MPWCSYQFKHGFNFNRNVIWQRTHSNRAAHTDTVVFTPYLSKEFTASVDDVWVPFKVSYAVHHAKHFYYALYAVEASKVLFQRCQDCEPNLSGSKFTIFRRNAVADTANDQRSVFLNRSVPGDVNEFVDNKKRFVNTQRFRC